MATQVTAPGLTEIERARERLDGVARVTPVFPSETLSRLAGRPVRLKAENLQRTGSFKIRGAYVKLSSLDPERCAAGVVAASAGNHGQAVAWAARELGAAARIFMPQDSPMAKVDATRNYGAEVELTGPAFEETLAEAQRVRRANGRRVHPSLRGHVRHVRPGNDRAGARRAGRRARDGCDSDRRRRARLGHLHRVARRAARAAARRRAGGRDAAGRHRLLDRRRDRSQGTGRADDGDSRARRSTTSSRSRTSRSRRRSSSSPSGRSSWSRAPARRARLQSSAVSWAAAPARCSRCSPAATSTPR